MTILVISIVMLAVAAAPSIADDIAAMGVNDIRSDGILIPNGEYAGGRDLDVLAQGGVALYRARMRLDCVDPAGTGTFNFTRNGSACYGLSYDDLVGALAGRGMTFLPALMNFARGGVSGDVPVPPTPDGANGTPTRTRFAAFAAAAARRYGAGGSFWQTCGCPPHPITAWEIWNEQNNGWWWGGNASAADYAGVFAETRSALRSADPNARAVVGGLIWDQAGQSSFVAPEEMIAALAAGNANAFDAVAIHPYTDARGKTGDQMADAAAALVQRMAATLVRTTGPAPNGGPRQQIWITEIGWSDTDNTPDAIAAAVNAFSGRLDGGLATAANVGPVIWYMLRDNGVKGARDDQLGLRYTGPRGADAGAKPAWGSFVDVARRRGAIALPPALADSAPYEAPIPRAVIRDAVDAPATPCQGADLPAHPGASATLQLALTCVVNAERQDFGLPALAGDRDLAKIGAKRAKTVLGRRASARHKKASRHHRRASIRGAPGGQVWVSRRSGARSTVRAVVNGWMGDPEVRAQLLAAAPRVGFGVALRKQRERTVAAYVMAAA